MLWGGVEGPRGGSALDAAGGRALGEGGKGEACGWVGHCVRGVSGLVEQVYESRVDALSSPQQILGNDLPVIAQAAQCDDDKAIRSVRSEARASTIYLSGAAWICLICTIIC